MKTKSVLLMMSLCFFFLISCKDAAEDTNPVSGNVEQEAEAGVTEEKVKVNPSHGLPGHRCDLPVGAPLTAGVTPSPEPVNQLPSTSVSPIRVDQTPTVNPPHGEPGHDCTVPVGAKLE